MSLIFYYSRIIQQFFIRRFPISEIPKDTKGSSNWIHELYLEKDEIYDYFARHDTFEGNGLPRVEVPQNYYDLLIELGWIIIIGAPSITFFFQFLYTSSLLAKLLFVPIMYIGEQLCLI